jgi:predicted DNA-binding transcriptional regulator YafY
MPINKLALIRYKTIDNCLRNRYRKWTLEDLVDACSDALYDYEGMTKGISKRAVQLDLQNMRSEKLGYNAPIIVHDKKYYTYEDKDYSITNSPITQQDLRTLNDVLDVLKQFNGFGYFQELNSMVTRLEDKLYKQKYKGKSYIDFEKNELLKGLHYIDPLLQAIIHKKTIEISYQSFKAKTASTLILYPYLLKEYRNRWFVLAANNRKQMVLILALDRIANLKELPLEPYFEAAFDVGSYFNDTIGVSKMPNQQAQLVVMKIVPKHAPYILTKPMHSSQKVLKEDDEGIIFSIEVVWNFELEREILGFGEHISILSPRRLQSKIKSRLRFAYENYTTQ